MLQRLALYNAAYRRQRRNIGALAASAASMNGMAAAK
jgi:hypothetical protein